MELNPDQPRQWTNRFKDALRQSGIKLTHQRMEIYREVARSGAHPDAETVHRGVRKRIPSVSLDTVYRTLGLLVELGLITTLGLPRERVRFDPNTRSHHHFVCVKCGMARDFYSEQFDELAVPDAVKVFGSVKSTHVEFRGVCSFCSQKKRK